MFKKILIANRGEIAVRILRACRELGIPSVALFQLPDQDSLHVRLADESVRLNSPLGFMDRDAIVEIARERGADAVHPGYGYLAEEADFIRACTAAGLAFIGPPAQVVQTVRDKIGALERARAAGVNTVAHSPRPYGLGELEPLRAAADVIGYPVILKSCRGGRGRGERLVPAPQLLDESVRRAQTEAQAVYGDRALYLERAIPDAHQVAVQIVADRHGNLVHLGDREGSLRLGNQKILEESPAPCLTEAQRQEVVQVALQLARLFSFENAGTVEFLVDGDGRFYFTEIKARISLEHPLTEMLSRVDLVQEQLRVAAGLPLSVRQEDVSLRGWAMQCRVRAEDPSRNLMPTPGRLRRVRLPSGPEVRVDTYVYSGYDVPPEYDPLLAKLVVWGPDREACLARMQRALREYRLIGIPTNLPLLERLMAQPEIEQGRYHTGYPVQLFQFDDSDGRRRDLAVAAAILYVRRTQTFHPTTPERLRSGWHRDSRAL